MFDSSDSLLIWIAAVSFTRPLRGSAEWLFKKEPNGDDLIRLYLYFELDEPLA